jgi:hypothetical protein
LRREVLSNQRKQGEGEPELFEGIQGVGHTEIVEEFSPAQKCEETGSPGPALAIPLWNSSILAN